MPKFETFAESHYSQTTALYFQDIKRFETFAESHYSQTYHFLGVFATQFETFAESHYSQTPNTSLGFQSLSSHHQV